MHGHIPGDKPRAKIHRYYHVAVPEFPVPKIAFCHTVAHKRRAQYRKNSTDDRAAKGNKGGVVNARHLEDIPVVGKMYAPGQPYNTTHGDIVVVAYGIDDNVVKRPDTDQGKKAEDSHINKVKYSVAGSFSELFHARLS
jgi:hypothetical protein